MPWFKVDDGFPTHHKVLTIPRGPRRLAAIGAWTLGGAWSSKNLKEGRIPLSVVDELAIPAKVVSDLTTSGLWLTVEDGYLMHDFLDYNPTAAQVVKDRADAAERQRRARERAKASKGQGDLSRRDSRVTRHGSHGPRHGPPDPTRPDPFLGDLGEEVEVGLPEPWDHFEEPPPTPDELEAAAAALCSSLEGWSDVDADELAELRRRRGVA